MTMGGRSSSSTQQVSNQFDQRQVNTWNTTTNNSQRYDISTSDDHRINVADDHRVNLNDNHSFALDGGSVYAGAGANVSTTDFGAVRDSFGFGEQLAKLFGSQASRTLDTADSAIAAGGRTAGQAFDFAGGLTDKAIGFLGDVFKQQTNANAQTQSLTAAAYNDAKGRGAMTDTILMVTVGGALLVAFFALRK